MSLTESLAQKAIETGGRLRVRSALNPVLWLCGIITIPGLVFIGAARSEPSLVLQIVICLPVIVASFGFVYLLCFDRDKLQSEDYQIRKRSLELVQEKGDRFPVMARTIEAITNPKLEAFDSRLGEGTD